jgi:hypothetical protein
MRTLCLAVLVQIDGPKPQRLRQSPIWAMGPQRTPGAGARIGVSPCAGSGGDRGMAFALLSHLIWKPEN